MLAVSVPVRHLLGGTTCDAMVLSCQLASSLAAVLLVIPMFYLGRELFDRRVGFWSAALFQCLPVTARITSDALSEATFLLFITSMLFLAAQALHGSAALRFALCGLFGGLAYLTRPEGALAVAATGIVLLSMQAIAAWRRPWRRLLVSAASLGGGTLLVASPYMLIIGGVTIKPTPSQLLKKGWHRSELPRQADQEASGQGDNDPEAVQASWSSLSLPISLSPPLSGKASSPRLGAGYLVGLEARRSALVVGPRAQSYEIVKSYHYLVWVPVLIGLWCFRDRLRSSPGAWVLLALFAIHSLILWRMAVVVGYLSERHVQLLILCGIFWAVAAIAALGDRLAALTGQHWLSWALLLGAGRLRGAGVAQDAAQQPLGASGGGSLAGGACASLR